VATPLRALTTDLWYTLAWVRPRDHGPLEQGRVGYWCDPLMRAGYSRERAIREVRRLDAWSELREAAGHAPSITAQARWFSHRYHVRVSGEAMGTALDALIDRTPIQVAPGARAALAELAAAGVRRALVSNLMHETGPGARRLLERLGLLEFLEEVVFSDEHPWSKPAPTPFRYALRRLRVPPDRAAHIGDLAYDILGAQRAGMQPILYTGLHRWEPTRLRGLAQVVDPSAVRLDQWRLIRARVPFDS
jgi:HAD superfamily hydrolase (TIGR01509 family)